MAQVLYEWVSACHFSPVNSSASNSRVTSWFYTVFRWVSQKGWTVWKTFVIYEHVRFKKENPADRWTLNVLKHRATAIEILECNFGLMDYLLSYKVMTTRIRDNILSQKPFHKNNEEFWDWICSTDFKPEPYHKLEFFVDALKKSHQRHIAALLLNERDSL